MATVRSACSTDANRISELLRQLGYSADLALVHERLGSIAASAADAVLVVEGGDRVVAVVSLHTFDLFHQAGRIGRITAFVVDPELQGQGLGSMLIQAADDFFQRAGCVRAEVTSGDHRPRAHAFYKSHGYAPDERRFLKRYDLTDRSNGPLPTAADLQR